MRSSILALVVGLCGSVVGGGEIFVWSDGPPTQWEYRLSQGNATVARPDVFTNDVRRILADYAPRIMLSASDVSRIMVGMGDQHYVIGMFMTTGSWVRVTGDWSLVIAPDCLTNAVVDLARAGVICRVHGHKWDNLYGYSAWRNGFSDPYAMSRTCDICRTNQTRSLEWR